MPQPRPLHRPWCRIVPPWLIQRLTGHPSAHVAGCADRTLRTDRGFRGAPRARTAAPATLPPAAAGMTAPRRQISDARGSTGLPGAPVRSEGAPPTGDPAADEAYDGLGQTWELFWSAFERDSLDAAGAPVRGTVHYDQDYDNAFWDGTQMVFGDGDGEVFRRFTLSLDVIGHELTHGITERTARLTYQGQSGALNESVSDVFGSLVRQHHLGQDAAQADWLIGSDLFTEQVQGVALRSLKAPGTAYDDDVIGRDPQPATMTDYVETTDDDGGVHINSGIPNHAFYLAATALGGAAWERAGRIWYDVLAGSQITPDCDFATFAALTVTAAEGRFGQASVEQTAVRRAWQQVGLLDDPSAPAPPAQGSPTPVQPGGADVEAPVELVRSGGVAGMTRRTTFVPSQLDPVDAEEWRRLLDQPDFWAGLTAADDRADGYTYRVRADRPVVDTTVSERELPDPVRALVRRTLDLAGP